MNTAIKRIYVDVPEDDVALFQRVVKGMGWTIPDKAQIIDDFFDNLPQNPDITEEEIMEEVSAVRYGE